MDSKKQDLNPELKQIYDRVMSTQVTKAPPQASPQNPPQGPQPVQPQNPGPGAPPIIPQAPTAAPAQQAPQPAPGQPVATQAPNPTFTPVPPRPITTSGTFAFTGNKVSTSTSGGVKTMLSGKIIGVLVVILLIVWGAFWAKLFGIF